MIYECIEWQIIVPLGVSELMKYGMYIIIDCGVKIPTYLFLDNINITL